MNPPSSAPHLPVLLSEVLDCFAHQPLRVFVDGTLGAGGHAEAVLQAHSEIERFVGIDQDPIAQRLAAARLEKFGDKVSILSGNFRNIGDLLSSLQISEVDGILLDIGVSSMQLDVAERGFSFSKLGPLDMRMSPSTSLTAEEIVNEWSEPELERILRDFGEIPFAAAVARKIVQERKHRPIHTTQELVEVLRPFFHKSSRQKIHPMTLIFQALRIAVNDELEALKESLEQSVSKLRKGGRLAIITFHSLEDRIVKQFFREAASDRIDDPTQPYGPQKKEPVLSLVTKKPIVASHVETRKNPRSRSAKLRVAEKL